MKDAVNGLPPLAWQQRVDACIHRAVVECAPHLNIDPSQVCTLYAAVGYLVLMALTKQQYAICAGSFFVKLPNGLAFEQGPAVDGGHGGSFHAWLARQHSSRRIELIDFTTRWVREQAQRVYPPPPKKSCPSAACNLARSELLG